MIITFNDNKLHLPGDKPIEIIVHKMGKIEYCKTSDENYIGIRLTKGDRDKKPEDKTDAEKAIDALVLSAMPFKLGSFDSKTIYKGGTE